MCSIGDAPTLEVVNPMRAREPCTRLFGCSASSTRRIWREKQISAISQARRGRRVQLHAAEGPPLTYGSSSVPVSPAWSGDPRTQSVDPIEKEEETDAPPRRLGPVTLVPSP